MNPVKCSDFVMTISLTETAAQHVADQLATRGHGIGIRVGVKTTGCSGMAYVLEFVDALEVSRLWLIPRALSILMAPKWIM